MATTPLMSHIKSRKLWRKKHLGSVYEISCKKLGVKNTKEDGVIEANRWWIAKLDEINGTVQKEHRRLAGITEKYLQTEVIHALNQAKADLLNMVQDSPHIAALCKIMDWQVEQAKTAICAIAERQQNDFVEKYLILEKEGGNSITTIRGKRTALGQWEEFLDGRKLDGVIWHNFYSFLKSEPIEENVMARKFRAVKAFLNWQAEFHGLELPANFNSKKWKFKSKKKKVKHFTDEQVSSILQCAQDRERLYILLYLNCGQNPVDMARLLKSEGNLDRGIVVRQRSKTDDNEDTPIVTHWLWPETIALLREHQAKSGNYFLAFDVKNDKRSPEEIAEKELERESISRALRKVLECAGIKDCPKTLRATSAQKLQVKFKNKDLTKLWLGHAPNNDTVNHYINDTEDALKEACEYLHSCFNLA